jgi:hypothetical protein
MATATLRAARVPVEAPFYEHQVKTQQQRQALLDLWGLEDGAWRPPGLCLRRMHLRRRVRSESVTSYTPSAPFFEIHWPRPARRPAGDFAAE